MYATLYVFARERMKEKKVSGNSGLRVTTSKSSKKPTSDNPSEDAS